jgi:hypothetical protein
MKKLFAVGLSSALIAGGTTVCGEERAPKEAQYGEVPLEITQDARVHETPLNAESPTRPLGLGQKVVATCVYRSPETGVSLGVRAGDVYGYILTPQEGEIDRPLEDVVQQLPPCPEKEVRNNHF